MVYAFPIEFRYIYTGDIHKTIFDKFWVFLKINIFETRITYGSTGISTQVFDDQNQMWVKFGKGFQQEMVLSLFKCHTNRRM
jgi:hypothetical protein